ncbi:MAG: hypothetical protein NZM33_04055 [Bryobacteraceae bacterium]|nr:hypothetical protein [Bryobacteraceae bacterium]
MAITNHERVGKALDLLRTGLAPFIEREFKSTFGQRAQNELPRALGEDRLTSTKPAGHWDTFAPLKVTRKYVARSARPAPHCWKRRRGVL